ncbi:Uncharacterised protein g8096 [Pycnogonum litorale]
MSKVGAYREREVEMGDVTPGAGGVTYRPNQDGDSSADGNTSSFDFNVYATKKTVAKGLFDVALLTHNAVELKQVLEIGEYGRYYVLMLTLLPISMLLQIAVGILLLILGPMKIGYKNRVIISKRAEIINNVVTGLIFFIVVINIMIAAFSGNNFVARPIEP